MLFREIFRPQYYVPLIAGILLSLSPFILRSPFLLHILIMMVFSAALGCAWNLIGGYGGQVSLGHTAFFGIGAYTSTILFTKFGICPWWGILVGSCLSMIVAAIVGYPSLRLKGPFFTLSTIAFAEVLQIIAVNWPQMTAGSVGIGIEFKPAAVNLMFLSKRPYAFLAIGMLFSVLAVVFIMEKSRFGYYLLAIRENEDGAKAVGINTLRYKVIALIISAFFTSLWGTFYAQYILFIDPYTVFSLDISIQMALVAIIGGLGTTVGPVIGAFLMTPLGEFLRVYLGGEFRGLYMIIYGAILILVVIFIPHGIMEKVRKRYGAIIETLPDFGRRLTFPGRGNARANIIQIPELRSSTRTFKASLLEVGMLSKFFGGLAAVHRVNFSLRQGEILGLIGPNGAGKTTLFNLISGFYAPNQGEILYKGREISRLAPNILCHMGIGRTFQIVKPFENMSALDNIIVGAFCRVRERKLARIKAEEISKFVGLWDKRDLRAKNLTLAEKKHLELAKALATQPELILLDEVMAGLNPRELTEVVSLIRKINKEGITIIIIEHVMSAIISLCHRVVVLHHGEKIAEGTPEEIVNDPRVVEAYLGEEYLIA
jgi:branched-chain amino acid transport system permease protein